MWQSPSSTNFSISALKLQLRHYAKKMAQIEGEKTDLGLKDKLIEERLKHFFGQSKSSIAVFSPLKHEPHCFIDLAWWNEKSLLLPMVEGGWVNKGRLEKCAQWPAPGKTFYRACASLEEILPESPGIILVPGLLFSADGCRLGLGKGWFDRSMAGLQALRIGVCYEWALQSFVPSEFHDLSMDWIITELQTIKCKG